jgi:hypothetical protein
MAWHVALDMGSLSVTMVVPVPGLVLLVDMNARQTLKNVFEGAREARSPCINLLQSLIWIMLKVSIVAGRGAPFLRSAMTVGSLSTGLLSG